MANTPRIEVRVEPETVRAVRDARPELAELNSATLLRVGLLVLAGHDVRDAIPLAKRRRGKKVPVTT
jgi:hypothetical protein